MNFLGLTIIPVVAQSPGLITLDFRILLCFDLLDIILIQGGIVDTFDVSLPYFILANTNATDNSSHKSTSNSIDFLVT